VHRLSNVLGGNLSGNGRLASRRHGEDLVLLAHIRAQFSTSSETYDAPCMMPNSGKKVSMSGVIVWPD
jgi:hypothetical protein